MATCPTRLPLVEQETRYDYADPEDHEGIDETCRVDRCTHSLFGVSKLAGDVMTQEYGRYFGMKTGVFRGGCLTGPFHSAVELHGFLAYMVRVALEARPYNDHRLQGEAGSRPDPQRGRDPGVRGLLPRSRVPARCITWAAAGATPPRCWSCSTGSASSPAGQIRTTYDPTPRVGDHICYISNLAKLRAHYPGGT